MYNDLITINCCGKKQQFKSRPEAIRYYYAAMENCNDKTMYNEYAKIFCQLMEGKDFD